MVLMMKNKYIIILLAVITITIPITVDAMRESWIDVDCTTLHSSGMIPICNDINFLSINMTQIDDRLLAIEGIYEELRLFPPHIFTMEGDDNNIIIEWTWYEYSIVERYYFEYSTSPLFDVNVLNSTRQNHDNDTTERIRIYDLEPYTTYYIRVMNGFPTLEHGKWSEIFVFTTVTPR